MTTIGFTGTQQGMNGIQKMQLNYIFEQHPGFEFHHGDCIGADEEAHNTAMNFPDCKIVIHPPNVSGKRAFCKGHIILPELWYLDRNKKIVDACEFLVAAPGGEEVLRSGTWSTVRYARKLGKKVIILPWAK